VIPHVQVQDNKDTPPPPMNTFSTVKLSVVPPDNGIENPSYEMDSLPTKPSSTFAPLTVTLVS